LNNLGMLQIGLGDLDSASRNLTDALTAAREIGDIITQGIVQRSRDYCRAKPRQ
jgi:hypothetical protein